MKKLAIIILISLMIISTGSTSEIVYALNENKPTLNVYPNENNVRVEWAIEMPDSNVMEKTGYEIGDMLPGFYEVNGKGQGGQSFQTGSNAYSGNRYFNVKDTLNNSNYNAFTSLTAYGTKYYENGTELSITFRAKSDIGGTITPWGNGSFADSIINYGVELVEDAKVGDTILKLNSIDSPYLALGQHIFFDTGGDYRGGYVTIYARDEINNTLSVSTITQPYSKGHKLAHRPWRTGFNFQTQTIPGTNTWDLYSINTKTLVHDDYDLMKRGVAFYTTLYTEGEMSIDDLKIGYATQAELYRNGQKIYEGKLSNFEDKLATDKAKPDMIEDYIVNKTDDNIYLKPTQPSDNGSEYNYQLKAISHDGSEHLSDIKSINVMSGIEGYSFKISNKSEDIPLGNINSTDGIIEIPSHMNEHDYLHIQTIDKEGNRSDVKSISAEELESSLPKVTVLGYPENWVRDSITVRMLIDSEHSLQKVTLPDGIVIDTYTDRIDYTFKENGEYLFIFEDVKGNKLTYVFNVDKIDTISPEINVSQLNSLWTNTDSIIRVEANDEESGIKGIRLLTDTENKNILSLNSVLDSDVVYGNGVEDRYFHKEDGEITFNQGSNHFSGITIPYLREFEDDEDYTLSFYATKLNGEIGLIGGHLKFSEETKVYIDGVEMPQIINTPEPNTWSAGYPYPNDTEKHFIEVQFKTGSLEGSLDNSINIQPNRYKGLKDYTMKVENLQIEKGLRATEYVLNNNDSIMMENPVDYVAEENGIYVFEAIDHAGNGVTGSVEVTNIDKKAPEVNIRQDIVEETHGNIILTVEASDNLSGVKSITYLGEVLENGQLEVTKDGEYSFAVEDYAGNITTKTHVVNNITKELDLEIPEISENIEVIIQEKMDIGIPVGNMKITDWRDKENNWKVMLEATPLRSEFHSLPKGTLSLAGIDKVTKLNGDKSGSINILADNLVIDDGAVEIMNAFNERGEYEVKFKDNAFRLNLLSSMIRQGTYSTRLTWTLESTSEIE